MMLLLLMLAADLPKPQLTDAEIIEFLKARTAHAEAQVNVTTTKDTLQAVYSNLVKKCKIEFPDGITPRCATPQVATPVSTPTK